MSPALTESTASGTDTQVWPGFMDSNSSLSISTVKSELRLGSRLVRCFITADEFKGDLLDR